MDLIFDGDFHKLDTPVEITGMMRQLVLNSTSTTIPGFIYEQPKWRAELEQRLGDDLFLGAEYGDWFEWEGNTFALKVKFEPTYEAYSGEVDGPIRGNGYDAHGGLIDVENYWASEGPHMNSRVVFKDGEKLVQTGSTPMLVAYFFGLS